MKRAALLISAALLAGCVSLAPAYERPGSPVPDQWPAYAETADARAKLPAWRSFYGDPKLVALIDIALEQNRDLRIAALNIERARQAYRIQRSDLLPNIDAGAQATSQEVPTALGGAGET